MKVLLFISLVYSAYAITYFSFTIDDTYDYHFNFSQVLDQYGMKATFYINSGRIGQPGRLSLDQIYTMIANGHEFGGHTIDHQNMTALNFTQQKYQICQDRQNLLNMNIYPMSFAYPFGATSNVSFSILAQCGYNSARTSGGLQSNTSCQNCPLAESIPPTNPLLMRSASYSVNLGVSGAQWYIRQGMNATFDGWVMIIFHEYGNFNGTTTPSRITPDELLSLVLWLKSQSNVSVVTVSANINATFQPIFSTYESSPNAKREMSLYQQKRNLHQQNQVGRHKTPTTAKTPTTTTTTTTAKAPTTTTTTKAPTTTTTTTKTSTTTTTTSTTITTTTLPPTTITTTTTVTTVIPTTTTPIVTTRAVAAPPAPIIPAFGASGTPYIVFTFDYGTIDHFNVSLLLKKYNMTGSFYVSSSTIGTPGYLSLQNLTDMQNNGHEIGSRTQLGLNQLTQTTAQQTAQICTDLTSLKASNLNVTTLSWPFGASDSAVQTLAQNCGFKAARNVGGYLTLTSCASCPSFETLPFSNKMQLRSYYVRSSDTLGTLMWEVWRAEDRGTASQPRVLVLGFGTVCTGCQVSPTMFEQFLVWLSPRTARGTSVGMLKNLV